MNRTKPDPKIFLSLVIPAKDKRDPKLSDLLLSIEAQDFPKEQLEVLVITEGTSESAKAIGIRRAKGDVIGILASDNELLQSSFLSVMFAYADKYGASYPAEYAHIHYDDALNRCFALIGGNDPLAYYMRKNDRFSVERRARRAASLLGSIGDNGFFIRKEMIENTDLDNYYHIDNAIEATSDPESIVPVIGFPIWHKTGGNLLTFFQKRYRYGLQHAFNKNRRWHLVDFRKPKDIMRLTWFILASLTVVHPLWTSIRGYLKLRDLAWFLHPVLCLGTVFLYTALVMHVGVRQLYRSLFVPTEGKLA